MLLVTVNGVNSNCFLERPTAQVDLTPVKNVEFRQIYLNNQQKCITLVLYVFRCFGGECVGFFESVVFVSFFCGYHAGVLHDEYTGQKEYCAACGIPYFLWLGRPEIPGSAASDVPDQLDLSDSDL